ncbi:MAG: hypothetical protein Q8P24_08775 [Desulfobacterales bacterium]|nr:hypothetical protein [Desulfobacterales bacterium]
MQQSGCHGYNMNRNSERIPRSLRQGLQLVISLYLTRQRAFAIFSPKKISRFFFKAWKENMPRLDQAFRTTMCASALRR